MSEEPTTRASFRKSLTSLFSASKKEASDFSQEIKIKTKELKDLKDGAQLIANDLETKKIEATSQFDNLKKIDKDTSDTYKQYKKIITPALNQKSGVASKVKKIDKSFIKANGLVDDISGLKDESIQLNEGIKTEKSTAETNSGAIKDILSNSEDIGEKIQKTYRLVTDASLAGALFRRKRELNLPVYVWLGIFLVAAGLAIYILIDLSPKIASVNDQWSLLATKLYFLTPPVVVSIVAFTQYKHERKLLEEYAFKAVMANTVESYTTLLSKEFKADKDREKILDFVLKAMDGIYDQQRMSGSKFNFHFGVKASQLAHAEASIKEEVQEVATKAEVIGSDLSRELQDVADTVNELSGSSSASKNVTASTVKDL